MAFTDKYPSQQSFSDEIFIIKRCLAILGSPYSIQSREIVKKENQRGEMPCAQLAGKYHNGRKSINEERDAEDDLLRGIAKEKASLGQYNMPVSRQLSAKAF